MSASKQYSLLNNSRFYILVFALFLSVIVASFTRLTISSDQLFLIRTQQLFGLVSIMYWYLALIVSPIQYAIGKDKLQLLAYSRRAIGVSAAYFATLHAAVAVWGQLGGFTGLSTLSDLFKLSLIGGLAGLIVLLVMAATSFDKVITYMTFRRWKWLHRLVYAGGILAVLHIWSVGTHVGYTFVQLLAYAGLVLLAGLEMYRVVTLLAKKYEPLQNRLSFISLFVGLWLIWIALISSIPVFIDSYNNRHDHTSSKHNNGEKHSHDE